MARDSNVEIVKYVTDKIIGRIANKIGSRVTDNTEVLLDFVADAGSGNYLEIGTLFGGSAIAVALMKSGRGHHGMVFCIDPLDGYYRKYASRDDMMDGCGFPVTPETLFRNIDKFNVNNRIFVMKSYSTKCIPFWDIKFTTAYIDGDHQDGVPLKDWNYVKNMVTRYVIFDNCADTHPHVQEACKAATNDPEWECVYDKDITYVVERV